MSREEFNLKSIDYLLNGHYGLGLDNPELIAWLDSKFEEFIKKPNFKYSQIKAKFGQGRFYCQGLTEEEVREVETKISLTYNEVSMEEKIGGMLFSIHHHHPENEKIIYYEEDIIKLLKALGHPEPKFGIVLTIDDFEKQKKI